MDKKKLETAKEILSKIKQEQSSINPNSSEGLTSFVPLYEDLLQFDEDPIFHQSITRAKEILDILIASDSSFDASVFAYLSGFCRWGKNALGHIENAETLLPYPPFPEKKKKELLNQAGSQETEEESLDVLLKIDLEQDQDILSEFHAEALEHLEAIEAALLILENNPKDKNSISEIFRAFHTIKGVAGFLHLKPMHTLAHEIESLLDLARKDKLDLNSSILTLILESKDTLEAQILQIKNTLETKMAPSEIIPISGLIKRSHAIAQGESTSPSTPEDTQKSTQPSESTTQTKAVETDNIRVHTSKLDRLIERVGELVIIDSQFKEILQTQALNNHSLQQALGQLERTIKDIQYASMSLRMVPVKSTFQKINRLVRDLTNTIGKPVHFHISGEDTELDRSVVEQIGDPLIHMIRNALDHGIESEEDRVKSGKPPQGNLYLKAYHKGNNIVIEVTDDGRGLDTDRIYNKALKQGLIHKGKQLNPEDIYQFIFAAGFSTSKEVTDISGRGVGMDVVKRNIEKLRGSISIESTLEVGTTFKIHLPLTIALIDGIVIRVGQDRFVIPSTSIKTALRPEGEQLSKVQGKTEVLDLRGKMIPILRLYEQFKIPTKVTETTEGIVVIIESFGKSYGLLVDSMIAKQEVVIKNLGHTMQNIPGIAGGAILGDGSVALIIDPPSLVST